MNARVLWNNGVAEDGIERGGEVARFLGKQEMFPREVADRSRFLRRAGA